MLSSQEECRYAAEGLSPRLLRLKEVKERTSLSASSIYRLVKNGNFPQPLKLSERASAWLESEVTDWINERVAARPLSAAAARGASGLVS